MAEVRHFNMVVNGDVVKWPLEELQFTPQGVPRLSCAFSLAKMQVRKV